MNAKIAKTIVVSIIVVVAVFFSSAPIAEHRQSESLLLVGPVSSATDKSLKMMGQVVSLDSQAAKDAVKAIGSDSYVAVFGYISNKGKLTFARIEVLEPQYVPGSSPVMVSGLLKKSMDKNGRVSLGELTLDITPSLSTPTQIDSKEIAVFIGIQPNPDDGIVSAHSVAGFTSYPGFADYQNSYSGGFLAGIGGSITPFSIGGGDDFSIDGGDEE